MSTIEQLASLGASTTTANQSSTDRQRIADNFDTFLQLLTTQLQNQNPLEPLDTNQFTQQLVQFSGVEQQIRMNEQLESLVSMASGNATAMMVGYLGRTVTADGSQAELPSEGGTQWNYDAALAAPRTTVTITNSDGTVVYSEPVELAAGDGVFEWDGRTSTGSRAAPGLYTIDFDARDASGGLVNVDTEVAGTVTGVDMTGSEPVLEIGSMRLPASSVRTIAVASN
ncbi:MAG: flagellar hook assembly protein FlgD [Hyphomicrobiaceae bacterium]|nr:flagellar hook assembly protein FlgD [Hyphomicrobiaceae bacterium]